jgi:MraZ protein
MVNLPPSTPPPKFAGEFRHKVEGKGRITIPAKWRFAEEVEIFMVPKAAKRCITVMTREELDRMKEEISEMEAADRADVLDIFGRRLRQATLDKGGRITIPEDLCRQFGLAGEVVLSGAVDTFNIWNVADFEATTTAEQSREVALLRKLGL